MVKKSWDTPTSVLHWALVVTITFQLATGFLIASPSTRLFFYAHEIGGLIAMLAVLGHWMWSFANYDLPLLFPWSGEEWATVKSEFLSFLRGKLPEGGRRAGLSGFVHGLGLLAVTGMGLTGVLIFMVIPSGRGAQGASNDYAAFTALSVIHRDIGYLVWTYWLSHVGTTILHMVRHKPVASKIFLGRD